MRTTRPVSEIFLTFSPSDQPLYQLLKYILVLVAFTFAGSLSLVVLLTSSAATDTGSNPSLAISLINYVNTGTLGPKQIRWFRISPTNPSFQGYSTQSLVLISTVDNLAQNISLRVFEETQAVQFEEATNPLSPYGTGQWASSYGDLSAGVRWSGRTVSNETYYIQIVNDNEVAVDYWLLREEPHLSNTDASQPATAAPASTPNPEMGLQPYTAVDLPPGRNHNRLAAGATYWYTFSRDDPNQPSHFQDLSFSLFYTPDDGNRHNVNFQLFTTAEVNAWLSGSGRLNNFGAGMLVSRDGDPLTGERLWRGNVLRGDSYFLAIENGSEGEIDFWLYDQDISNPLLGPTEDAAAALAHEPTPPALP
ncbi:MAG: hypothetical protein KDI79_04495 [Anaerolineae bacterium]|nr:hypothetical protein [Anaerolineae bacterium]